MCPTVLGRIHTRVAIITLPALLALILLFVTGEHGYLVVTGIYLLMGIALDALVYSWLLRYQPPWMTLVLALAEFGILYALVGFLDTVDLTVVEIVIFYWVAWILGVWTKIVVLPILSLTYLESAGEFRRIEWSVPPGPRVAAHRRGRPRPVGRRGADGDRARDRGDAGRPARRPSALPPRAGASAARRPGATS